MPSRPLFDGEACVLRHLLALVPRGRAPQLAGQRDDTSRQRREYLFGAAAAWQSAEAFNTLVRAFVEGHDW